MRGDDGRRQGDAETPGPGRLPAASGLPADTHRRPHLSAIGRAGWGFGFASGSRAPLGPLPGDLATFLLRPLGGGPLVSLAVEVAVGRPRPRSSSPRALGGAGRPCVPQPTRSSRRGPRPRLQGAPGRPSGEAPRRRPVGGKDGACRARTQAGQRGRGARDDGQPLTPGDERETWGHSPRGSPAPPPSGLCPVAPRRVLTDRHLPFAVRPEPPWTRAREPRPLEAPAPPAGSAVRAFPNAGGGGIL